jgi:hypothetical protein
MTMTDGRPTDEQITAYLFDLAEIRRMQRAQDEMAELLRSLARQRVRFILNRLVRR